jgi:hypothetical protein
MDAKQWASDLASVLDWAFEAQPNPYLNGRVASSDDRQYNGPCVIIGERAREILRRLHKL